VTARAPRPCRVFDEEGNEVLISKLCPHCHRIKPLRDFGLRKMADGKIRCCPWCKACRAGATAKKALAPVAAALALLLAARSGCAPAPRPPPPIVTPEQLAVLDRAHVSLAHLGMSAALLDLSDVRIATARTRAERRRAFATYLAARQGLRRRP
jgi:hypothetical protein